jgi:ubiquinone/menaquinone biosynthesis C-methylase UbiE
LVADQVILTVTESVPESAERYIHSFDPVEQARLIRQGRVLEPYIQRLVDFSGCTSVLEVGCGVGAQLHVLLQRFPKVHFTGIDRSPVQLNHARQFLGEAIMAGRVELREASAYELPFPDNHFDGVCIYFVLEHLAQPLPVLREVLRVLKPGGIFYCTEVFNSGLYAWPEKPGLQAYWRAFNQLQSELGGDPDVGIKLPALFEAAGFTDMTEFDASAQMDSRMPGLEQRRDFIDFWQALLLSAAPQLENHGRIADRDIAALKADFASLAEMPEAIFRYCSMQTRGLKPTEN